MPPRSRAYACGGQHAWHEHDHDTAHATPVKHSSNTCNTSQTFVKHTRRQSNTCQTCATPVNRSSRSGAAALVGWCAPNRTAQTHAHLQADVDDELCCLTAFPERWVLERQSAVGCLVTSSLPHHPARRTLHNLTACGAHHERGVSSGRGWRWRCGRRGACMNHNVRPSGTTGRVHGRPSLHPHVRRLHGGRCQLAAPAVRRACPRAVVMGGSNRPAEPLSTAQQALCRWHVVTELYLISENAQNVVQAPLLQCGDWCRLHDNRSGGSADHGAVLPRTSLLMIYVQIYKTQIACIEPSPPRAMTTQQQRPPDAVAPDPVTPRLALRTS